MRTWSYGLPIGGVLATENAVIPYAVGVDIACRMKLTVYDRKANTLAGQRDRLANLTEQLSLTPAQVEQIKPILNSERDAMRALNQDTSLDREAKRPKMREIREAHDAKIRALLTPEQQAKMDAMRPAGGKKQRNN